MNKMIAISVLAVSALAWVPEAQAQYEGSDARYAEERRESRSQTRWIKIGVGAIALVGLGGAWAYKKLRGGE